MATILYIDYDDATQEVVQSTLGKQHNIITAVNGPTAVQYCAMLQPDLILIDLALPDIDGGELVSRLKMFMPQTPVLAIRDYRLASHNLPDILAISNGILTKPLQAEELLQQVYSFLPPITSPPQFPAMLSADTAVEQFQTQITALNQANQRLASLNAISALIGTSLDLEHLMDEILAQVHKTVDFDSATLFLLKGEMLEAAASRGFTEHQRGMNIYRRKEKNSAWHAVKNKLPLVIRDVTTSEYWEPRPELSRIRSWLGVPLIYKDRVVGVLTLDKNEPDAFTDVDARYVFTLAYQIAIAVENAQLFEEWENQATRLKLINEVGREIATILEMNSLFDALAKAIFERLHYDRVAILQVDESRSFLILKAIYGNTPVSLKVNSYCQDIDVELIGKVILDGISVLINDVSQEDEAAFFAEMKAQSRLVVPIFFENQVEAVITVDSDRINYFDDHDLWTLSSLASQAAAVLANARLYRDLDQRLRDLAVLHDASQTLTSTIALEKMLAMITDRVCKALLAENGYVLLVEGRDNRLTFAAASGSNTAGVIGVKLDAHIKLIEQVILDDTPRMFKLSSANPGLFTELEKAIQRKIDTLLIAPVKTRGVVVGLVILINKQTDDFNADDLNLLSALSQLMAGAVENAQLFKQIHAYSDRLERTILARTERLQAIKKISQVVSRGLDLDELLTIVGRDFSQIFVPEKPDEVMQVIIGLVDGSKIDLRLLCGSETQEEIPVVKVTQPHPVFTQKIDLEKPIGQVIVQAKPLILNQIKAQTIYPPKFGETPQIINSVIMAPLITGGKTIGLIMIESQTVNAFDESDLETLEMLAFQVASAIEHARLLKKTRDIAIVEERTRLARDMHDGVAQNLAYLLIQVDRCLNMVEVGSKLEKQLEQISALLKQNIEELRRNIFDLRPVELEGKSIFEVLKNFVTEFGRRWNLKTTYFVEGNFTEIPPEVESSLYRILQETLSNARQHARCTELSVKVTIKDDQWVTLEVHDNGQGFDAVQVIQGFPPSQSKVLSSRERQGRGLGLTSIRERANRAGGQLKVESDNHQGTRVIATLPLRMGITTNNQ